MESGVWRVEESNGEPKRVGESWISTKNMSDLLN